MQKYRILPWADDVDTRYFDTQEERDRAAKLLALTTGKTMYCELWDASHPQDELNQGWACDSIVEPPSSPMAQLDGEGK